MERPQVREPYRYLATLATMPDAGMPRHDVTLENLAASLDLAIPKARSDQRPKLMACRDRLREAAAFARPIDDFRAAWQAVPIPALGGVLMGLGVPPWRLAWLMQRPWQAYGALRASNPVGDVAGQIDARLRSQDRTLIPCNAPGHAMLMEITKEPLDPGRVDPRQTYTLRIYNAGLGLEAHTPRRSNSKSRKFETVVEYTGVELAQAGDAEDGRSRLSGPEIERLLSEPLKRGPFTRLERIKNWWTQQMNRPPPCFRERVAFVYAWAAEKGVRRARPDVVPQAPQKGRDCASETSLAYLRQNLPDATYKWLKAEILTQALDFIEAVPAAQLTRPPDMRLTLKTRFQLLKLRTRGHYSHERNGRLHAKRESARTGIERAARDRREEARIHDEPWFLGRHPRGLKVALARLAQETGRLYFGITRSPDTKGTFAIIHTSAPGEVEWSPIRFDGQGRGGVVLLPDRREERFESLEALAEKMLGRGFVAAEPLRSVASAASHGRRSSGEAVSEAPNPGSQTIPAIARSEV